MKRISILLGIVIIALTSYAQKIDVNKSELKWTGKKVTGEHWGYIKLKSGSLNIENNKIVSGKFIIDMTTINCKDLEDPEWNKKLVGHLESDDFFSVQKYPTAKLEINKSTLLKNDLHEIEAMLSIKGITEPISFKAEKTENGYSAKITIDRTKYNVRYGSGKFFDNLGDNMIYDEFTLDVNLIISY